MCWINTHTCLGAVVWWGTPGPRSHAAEVMATMHKRSDSAAVVASDAYIMRLMQARIVHELYLQKSRPTRRQTSTVLERGLPASPAHTLCAMCSAGIIGSLSIN